MNPRDRACPTCEAAPKKSCVSGSGKPTSIHHARIVGVKQSKQNSLKPPRTR